MRLKDLGKPIIITENGLADARDDRRSLFLRRYLYAVSKAIHDGADVRGFFYWSLIDNFEWNLGFGMKFGLFSVDRQTMTRRLRDGSKYFQFVVRSFRGLPVDPSVVGRPPKVLKSYEPITERKRK